MWSVVENNGGWVVLWNDQAVGMEKPTYDEAVAYRNRLQIRYPEGAGLDLVANARRKRRYGGPYRVRYADGTSEVYDEFNTKAQVREFLLRKFGKMKKVRGELTLVPAKSLPRGTEIVPV